MTSRRPWKPARRREPERMNPARSRPPRERVTCGRSDPHPGHLHHTPDSIIVCAGVYDG